MAILTFVYFSIIITCPCYLLIDSKEIDDFHFFFKKITMLTAYMKLFNEEISKGTDPELKNSVLNH